MKSISVELSRTYCNVFECAFSKVNEKPSFFRAVFEIARLKNAKSVKKNAQLS